jgi:hypothetical protein
MFYPPAQQETWPVTPRLPRSPLSNPGTRRWVEVYPCEQDWTIIPVAQKRTMRRGGGHGPYEFNHKSRVLALFPLFCAVFISDNSRNGGVRGITKFQY